MTHVHPITYKNEIVGGPGLWDFMLGYFDASEDHRRRPIDLFAEGPQIFGGKKKISIIMQTIEWWNESTERTWFFEGYVVHSDRGKDIEKPSIRGALPGSKVYVKGRYSPNKRVGGLDILIPDATGNDVKSWEAFYSVCFPGSLKVDYSTLPIPEKLPGFEKLVVVDPVFNVFSFLEKGSPFRNSTTLSDRQFERIIENEAESPYAIWVADHDKPAELVEEKGGITMREFLLWDMKTYLETFRHPDCNNALCTGSTRSGVTPCAVQSFAGLEFRTWTGAETSPLHRTRQVIR